MIKKIKAVLDFNTNYLWHLWNLGNLWNKSEMEYSHLYKDSVSEKDRSFLYQNRDLLAWGNGRNGILTYDFFFLALKDDLSKDAFLSFFENEKQELLKLQLDKLPKDFDWFYDRRFDAIEIIEIIIKNLEVYEIQVWPIIHDKMKDKCLSLNQYFEETNLILKIETSLNRHLPFEEMTLLLSFANKYLPSANDISNCRWNYYYGSNQKDLTDLIKHELIINVFREEYMSLHNSNDLADLRIEKENLIWQANESFAEYLNSEIFGDHQIWKDEMFGGGTINMKFFFEWYQRELLGQIKNPDFSKLIVNSINAYLNND